MPMPSFQPNHSQSIATMRGIRMVVRGISMRDMHAGTKQARMQAPCLAARAGPCSRRMWVLQSSSMPSCHLGRTDGGSQSVAAATLPASPTCMAHVHGMWATCPWTTKKWRQPGPAGRVPWSHFWVKGDATHAGTHKRCAHVAFSVCAWGHAAGGSATPAYSCCSTHVTKRASIHLVGASGASTRPRFGQALVQDCRHVRNTFSWLQNRTM